MKRTNESAPRKNNTTVAISPEVALRLDGICRRIDITKKEFISLALDFFDNTGLSPLDCEQVLSWRDSAKRIDSIEESLSIICERTERSNEAIANIHGLVAGTVAVDIRNALEINNSKLIEEMNPKKRRWWQLK